MYSKKVMVINVSRGGYAIDEVRETMTVSDLLDVLLRHGGSMKVYITADDGHSYCGLKRAEIGCWNVSDDGHMTFAGE